MLSLHEADMPELPWQLVGERMESLREVGVAGMDIQHDLKGAPEHCVPWEDLGDELFLEASGVC